MAVKTYIVFPSYAIVWANDQFDLLFDMRHICFNRDDDKISRSNNTYRLEMEETCQ